jgi:hypothetical protein
MKNFIILIVFLIAGCSKSASEENYNSELVETESTVHANELMNLAELKLETCLVTSLVFDTTTILQNLYYEPEKPLLDYDMETVHVSSGAGRVGYLILSRGEQYMLCLVEGGEGYKIIGATPIPSLKEDENYVDMCESSCQGDFLTFGMVKEINDSAVRTLMAWRVNDDKKVIEQINPKAVDCNSSYFTDYD